LTKKRLLYVIGFAILLGLPFFLDSWNSYFLHIVIMAGIYMVLTLSLNLLVGYSGQFILGHAAFYGIGAYATALLMVELEWSFLQAIIGGAVISGLFGWLLGGLVMRMSGDYLGIVTLGFGEIIRLIFVNWMSLTRGPMGIPGIPPVSIFGFEFTGAIQYYFFIFLLVLGTVWLMRKIVYSGIGLSLLTLREDETVAASIGIKPFKLKLFVFVVSATLAGIAGGYWASYVSFISPDSFQYMESVNILSMVVIGGSGSIPGSIVGAIILTVSPEILRFTSEYRMIIIGLIIVIMMIWKPEGFLGEKYRRKNSYGKE
jgi:branched-chain amino acid transport system permease protein